MPEAPQPLSDIKKFHVENRIFTETPLQFANFIVQYGIRLLQFHRKDKILFALFFFINSIFIIFLIFKIDF